MLFELFLAILCGILFGCITGLIPGVHVNLVAMVLVSVAPLLVEWFSPLSIALVIIATATIHTFLDTIPSIYLGAPESATALGVLPGHRFLLQGKGYAAVFLTVLGSFLGLLSSLLLFPFFMWIIQLGYAYIQMVMGWILLGIVCFMILRDRHKVWAAIIFLSSGLLGYLVLNWYHLEQPLFPLLSGLFGVATLGYSLQSQSCFPPQKESTISVSKKVTLKALVSGVFSGGMTAILPGVGAATAATLSVQLTKKLGDYGFMILMGAISTVNFSVSLVTLYVLDKARNGALVGVKTLLSSFSLETILLFAAVALVAGSMGVFISLSAAKKLQKIMQRVRYRLLVSGVLVFLVVMTIVLSSWQGVLVLITATAIGLLPAIKKVARVNAMGCLLLPVIIFFLF